MHLYMVDAVFLVNLDKSVHSLLGQGVECPAVTTREHCCITQLAHPFARHAVNVFLAVWYMLCMLSHIPLLFVFWTV